jgi:hypothetical protein
MVELGRARLKEMRLEAARLEASARVKMDEPFQPELVSNERARESAAARKETILAGNQAKRVALKKQIQGQRREKTKKFKPSEVPKMTHNLRDVLEIFQGKRLRNTTQSTGLAVEQGRMP